MHRFLVGPGIRTGTLTDFSTLRPLAQKINTDRSSEKRKPQKTDKREQNTRTHRPPKPELGEKPWTDEKHR